MRPWAVYLDDPVAPAPGASTRHAGQAQILRDMGQHLRLGHGMRRGFDCFPRAVEQGLMKALYLL
jgi:hypothetical protein